MEMLLGSGQTHWRLLVKVGDKVRMEPMWKYESAVGEIEKITESYIIVKF